MLMKDQGFRRYMMIHTYDIRNNNFSNKNKKIKKNWRFIFSRLLRTCRRHSKK